MVGCSLSPTVIQADDPTSSFFLAENVLTFAQCEVYQEDYFLAPAGVVDRRIVVDLGCRATLSGFVLRNTKNSGGQQFRWVCLTSFLSRWWRSEVFSQPFLRK